MAENTKPTRPKRIYRTEDDRVIAGVAGGIADYLDIDVTIVRLAFVLLLLFGGSGFLLYFLGWIVIPTQSDLKHQTKDVVKKNAEEIKQTAESVVEDFNHSTGAGVNTAGLILIVLGIFFLIRNFGLFEWLDFERLWPVALILFGLFALRKNQ